MAVTAEQLARLHIKPELAPIFNDTFERWNIKTPRQQAAFIGQCGHESANFTKLEEGLSYSAARLLQVFPRTPKRPWGFTPEEAVAYARQPRKIANRIYGGRMGNRGEDSDDGWRFRGSGWVQLTGHDNFYHFSKAMGVDFVMEPDLVRTPQYAAHSAGWFWSTHNCNMLAESGAPLDGLGQPTWEALTRKINGGTIGIAERVAHTKAALAIFSPATTYA